MADVPAIDMEGYRSLKESGAGPSDVYVRAREIGLGKGDGVRIIRELYALTFEDAKAVVRQANLPIDRNPFELPPVRSYEELEQVLKAELGYCGCAAVGESIALLRDVLRCARDWQDAMPDAELAQRANASMLERLRFEQEPGLAIWFLYLLDNRNMIEHAGRITTCWITPKGRQLLEAIEEWDSTLLPDEGDA